MAFIISNIKDKSVTVLGAGRSGLSAAALLKRNGVDVFVSEHEPDNKKVKAKRFLTEKSIPFEFGGHTEKIFGCDFIVVSPGISISSDVIVKAGKKKIPVYGELEISSWFCKAPIIAITGSNGKSTTTELIGDIFNSAGKSYEVAGNIGKPFADTSDKIGRNSTAILEVSSFQLETIRSFHPAAAVILNLTPDHLNRHGSMKNYGELKAQIFRNQGSSDFLIYNGNDNLICNIAESAKSQRISFGNRDNEFNGAWNDNGLLALKINDQREEVIFADELLIKGEHNIYNALAAAAASRVMGVDLKSIRKSLKNFKGLPHRMEFVRKVRGVKWINDSKATNVDSVWYAIRSFNNPLILIAGGRDKNADFSKLSEIIQEKVKYLILIGEAAEKMKNEFRGINCRIVKSLEQAVMDAQQVADSGDSVILSPACASFDMFQDFEDRGNKFKNIVNKI